MSSLSFRLAMVGTLSALLAGCGSAPAASGASISFSEAHLSPYTASYRISGPATGTASWTVASSAQGAIQVTGKTAVGPLTEADAVTLKSPGWAVTAVRETISTSGQRVTISAHPSGQTMEESAVVNGRSEAPTVALRGTWQVNAVLLPALSGVPMKPGETGTIEDVVLQHATSAPLAVTVGKATTVTGPNGPVSCYPVTLSAGGRTQTAWYEVAAPHALVRYVNGKEIFTLTSLKTP